MEEGQTLGKDGRGAIIAWFAVAFSCVYFVWSYFALNTFTRVFLNLFSSMGVELPLPTRLVIASHYWLYPLLFCGAGVFLIAKEFVIRDRRISVLLTMAISLLVLFAVDSMKQVFILPLLDLVQKLK